MVKCGVNVLVGRLSLYFLYSYILLNNILNTLFNFLIIEIDNMS